MSAPKRRRLPYESAGDDMSISLVPDVLLPDYRAVTPDFLRARGVTLLLCDLDFTLAPKSVRHPDEAIRAWIDSLHAAGITVMIVSNNRSGRRVTDFCAELGIPYQGHAKKPGTEGLRKAMARAGKGKSETAMLGDKLLTDVLAARRAGVLSLMVEPLGGAVGPWQRVLHALQAPVKGLCRENTLRRGKKNR